MKKRRIISIGAALAVAASSFVLPTTAENTQKELVVFYTNDIHCGIDGNLGLASLSALKCEQEKLGNDVLLVDTGDAIQGAAIGALTDGAYIVDAMNEVGYDLAVPGNHEFDYGMDNLMSISERADYKYISTNFTDLTTNKTVFEPYVIEQFEEQKIAFIGICTPTTFASSTPAYFKNGDGEYIYGFCQGENELYENVQASIDSAKADGADIIIGIAHLGIESACSPWMSTEVIANTVGFDAVIDGHSHSTIEGDSVKDKDGNTVTLTSTGTKLAAIGKMEITADGEITTKLVTEYNAEAASEAVKAAYDKTVEFIASKVSEFDEILNTVVAKSDVDLITVDPETELRLIRNTETNLGDLCADAYRTIMGADIGFINGGGIRSDITAGDITYGDIIAVHPFGNMACLVEATGQQILDALELSVSSYPEEDGGFLHVSGLTYVIKTYVPSTVEKDEFGAFTGVSGMRRISEVYVNGERLDPERTYTVASHNYMLKNGGDGYSMFADCNILKDETYVDNEVLIKYITESLGGIVGDEYSDIYGENRFSVQDINLTDEAITDETIDETTDDEASTDETPADGVATDVATTDESVASDEGEKTENPVTGVASVGVCIFVVSAAVVLILCRRKSR